MWRTDDDWKGSPLQQVMHAAKRGSRGAKAELARRWNFENAMPDNAELHGRQAADDSRTLPESSIELAGGSMPPFTLEDARSIARTAHAGQVDKLGVDYMEHVEAVADALAYFPIEIQIAGMLHDVVEDSDITIADLRGAGVPEASLAAIALVSNNLGAGDYLDHIREICKNRDALLVKIADNFHNMHPDRVAELEARTGQPINPKYAAARELLWDAVDPVDLETIQWRIDEEGLREHWAYNGLDPAFPVLDEGSYYGDSDGMVDYSYSWTLYRLPNGRTLGLVTGDVEEEFEDEWPDDEAGQEYVRYLWGQFLSGFEMPEAE